MKITLLGAGAMGGALTFPLVESGHEVRLYGTGYDRQTIASLKQKQPHPRLNKQLPKKINLYEPEELEGAVRGTEILLLCVNTEGIRPIMDALLPYIKPERTLITIAKGFFEFDKKVHPITSGIEAYLCTKGVSRRPVVGCMAGPSIADELARQLPTAVDLASTGSSRRTQELADTFSTKQFSVRAGRDIKGLEICAAFKNIYSIALSWPQGLGEDESGGNNEPINLKAILMLQALSELEKIIRVAGGRPETARGLAGLGDLVATSGSGRNGSFGKLLAGGLSTDEAMRTLDSRGIHTVEGLDATPMGLQYIHALHGLSRQSLPLLSAIGQVIEGATTPQNIVSNQSQALYREQGT